MIFLTFSCFNAFWGGCCLQKALKTYRNTIHSEQGSHKAMILVKSAEILLFLVKFMKSALFMKIHDFGGKVRNFALLRFLDSRCRPGEAGEHPCPSHDPREGTWEKAEERAERAVEVRAVARTHIESQSPPARLLPVPMCQVSSEVEACTMTLQPIAKLRWGAIRLPAKPSNSNGFFQIPKVHEK